MASIFSRIVAGEIPCYKVAEDENYFAFLDISPVAKGHTLVIPKQEVDYIFDLDDETYVGLTRFAKRWRKLSRKRFLVSEWESLLWDSKSRIPIFTSFLLTRKRI